MGCRKLDISPLEKTPLQLVYSAGSWPEKTGVSYSYFGARYYDPNISIWLSVDPLSDKYPGLTSYSYCAGNPIMLMDPDGREVIIGGEARRAFYKEVKKGAAALGISVRMNRDGVLSAKYKGKGDISKDGQMFLDAVSSTTEKVKINATNSDHADGMPFCGGAFMGNEITSYSLGRGNTLFPATITANQIVNPNDLRIIDNYYGKSGQTSIHEITEAHQGALLSMGSGISSGNANAPNSVYQQAHIAATPQSGIIYENRYDAQDNWLPRGEWHKAKWIDYNVGKPPHDNNVKTIELN